MAWGSHDLVVAARSLLAAALADPANQRFLLLSESGVPLYPPATIHAQLLSEGRSRVNACGTGVWGLCDCTAGKYMIRASPHVQGISCMLLPINTVYKWTNFRSHWQLYTTAKPL